MHNSFTVRRGHYRQVLANLGVVSTLIYAYQWWRNRWSRTKGTAMLWSKHAQHPLACRLGTSDMDVFRLIFVYREYRCVDDIKDAELVIDCGANVGYASAYFLSRFPRARVVAIEPDAQNFAVLERNLAPYGSRVCAIRSGVWSHKTGLVLSEEPFGDGREWARTVRVVKPGEAPAMLAVDIGSILEDSGHERISLLKIDVEGAEAVLFSSNFEWWLERVDNLLIELHGPQCEAVFAAAIADRGFVTSRCGELTVCRRIEPHRKPRETRRPKSEPA